jgi:uncharacterized Zn finger protein
VSTETLAEKAARLLAAGNVHLLEVASEVVAARVFGDSGVYDVSLAGGRWSCTCPARAECSHLDAVQRVTVPPWARRRTA